MKSGILADYSKYEINSLIIKVVSHCNLRCDYCYRNIHSPELKVNIMDDVLVADIIHKFVDYNKDNKKPLVFVWHGGEPLLAGINFYEKVLNIQKQYSDRRCINVIQTNATLIDEKWAKFIKDNDITIGISLDGPQVFNDVHRKNKNGGSAFKQILNGINNLKKANCKFNAICVITNENHLHAKEMLDFFAGLDISMVDFIPCFDYDEEYTLTNENYVYFMEELFDYWMKNYREKIKIRFLFDIIKKLVAAMDNKSMPYVGCELSDMCGRNIAILDEGEVFPCACLTPIPEMQVCNIKESTFKDFVSKPVFKQMITDFNNVNEKCFDCDVKEICCGGCFNRRLPQYSKDHIDFYCNARREIIHHVKNNLGKYF